MIDSRRRGNAGLRLLVAGLLCMLTWLALAPAASAETRTLKLYFTHTRERAEITFKRNGRYVPEGLNQINRFLRDWRRNESTKMDPRLLDLLWETYQSVGARDYIHVVSAYRSPATNAMLRSRSSGVAKKSQHMLGKAIDFYIPGVSLAKLRHAALSRHGGGVGYYPKSGSPFVHLDVGSVRHWPRMSRQELMAMFPDGKTLHIPSDGKPLPGYQQALAAYKRKGSAPVVMASAEAASPSRKGGGFLAALLRGGADREEDEAEARTVARAPARARTAQPAAAPQPATPAAAPEPPAEPAAPAEETPALIMASLPAASIPLPHFAPRAAAPEAAIAASVQPAAPTEADPAPIAEAVGAAAVNGPRPTPRPADTPGLQAIAAVMTDDSSGLDDARAILGAGAAVSTGIPAELSFVPQPAPRKALPAIVTALAPVEVPAQAAAAWIPGPARAEAREKRELSPEAVRRHAIAALETPDGQRPLAVSARTTDKAQRPAPEDAHRNRRKAQIVPIPRHLTQRAFASASIARTVPETIAPTFTFSANHLAPREVYTDGFRAETTGIDPHRFTGKAVNFLSIARFN